MISHCKHLEACVAQVPVMRKASGCFVVLASMPLPCRGSDWMGGEETSSSSRALLQGTHSNPYMLPREARARRHAGKMNHSLPMAFGPGPALCLTPEQAGSRTGARLSSPVTAKPSCSLARHTARSRVSKLGIDS